jgi:hypothetical protein
LSSVAVGAIGRPKDSFRWSGARREAQTSRSPIKNASTAPPNRGALASTDVVKTDVTIDASGKLGGTGMMACNVTNAGGAIAPGGVSKPGAAPGVLTITGNLTDSQPSELDILFGGTTPGTEYSQLIVDGTASLLGSLDLSLVDGFSLTSGETFDIVGTATA